MVNIKQDSPSLGTAPQNNCAMLAPGSPQLQDDPTIGGFQPQSSVVNVALQPVMQPQSPTAMGNFQPNSPAMAIPYQYQHQSPVVITNAQPQAIEPMRIQGRFYVDHGANNHVLGSDGKRNWSYGLMDFTGRCGLCCCALWCPCVVFSKTRQRMRNLQTQGRPLEGGGSRCSDHCWMYSVLIVIGHPWIMQVQPRVELRERYRIRGQVLNDCAASLICHPCALTQERREVEMEEASFRGVQQQLVQLSGK